MKFMEKKSEDVKALEEFWLWYTFSMYGTVVFVCDSLELEELEIIKELCFF